MSDTFSSDDIAAALHSLGASSMPLQMYAQVLLQQPLVTLDGVPNLFVDLQSAHSAAKSCLTLVMPQVLRVDADTLGFANEILAFYPKLTVLAKAIDSGSPGVAATTSFIEGLQLLTDKINALLPTLTTLDSQVAKLSTDAALLATSLAADAVSAAGDQDITDLQQQITTTMQAIDADCQTISTGLKGTIKGMVKMGIAVFNCEDEPVRAAKTFVGTIVTTAKQSETVIAAEQDVDKQIQTLGALYAELGGMMFAAAVAQTASTSASLFSTNATRTQSSSQQTAAAWSALAAGFTTLGSSLSAGIPPANPLAPMLAAAELGWQKLLAITTDLQSAGLLPVEYLSTTAPDV